jgi:hypothetical protein
MASKITHRKSSSHSSLEPFMASQGDATVEVGPSSKLITATGKRTPKYVEAFVGDENGAINRDNPFLDPAVAARFAEVYEKSQYECRHVFDPHLTWTKEEEKRVIRKLDRRITLWAVCALALTPRYKRSYVASLLTCTSVSCFSRFKLIEGISLRQTRPTFWETLGYLPMVWYSPRQASG